MRSAFAVFILFGISNAYAMVDYGMDLNSALIGVRSACIGVSDELDKMKTMAGIGTAVSGVGTVTGVVATASGVKSVKALGDAQSAQKQVNELTALRAQEQENWDIQNKSYETESARLDALRDGINKNLKAAEGEYSKLSADLSAATILVGNARSAVSSVDQSGNLESDLNEAKDKVNQLQARLNKLSGERNRVNSEYVDAREAFEPLEAEYASAVAIYNTKLEKLKELSQETKRDVRATAQSATDTLKYSLEALVNPFAVFGATKSSVEFAVNSTKAAWDATKTPILAPNLVTQITALGGQIKQIKPRYEKAKSAYETAGADLERINGQLSQVTTELKNWRARVTSLTSQITVIGNELTAARDNLAVADEAYSGAESAVDDQQRKLNALRQQLDTNGNARTTLDVTHTNQESQHNAKMQQYDQEINAATNEMNQSAAQAKKSGNLRTGMLAVTTVTNAAGAVMAGSNRGRVNGTLGEMVDGCVDAVKVLSNVYGQARISTPDDGAQLMRAKNVIGACGDWETVNLDPIRNRATGAMVSNIVGAGTGAVGTIVSAVSVGKADLERAQKLGKTANTMAGVATVASGVATIFNASQIGAIKRAASVADACRDALSGVGE